MRWSADFSTDTSESEFSAHTALSPSIKRKLIEILQKPVPRILVAVRTAAERTKPSFCTVG
jgi:hypothetical protein